MVKIAKWPSVRPLALKRTSHKNQSLIRSARQTSSVWQKFYHTFYSMVGSGLQSVENLPKRIITWIVSKINDLSHTSFSTSFSTWSAVYSRLDSKQQVMPSKNIWMKHMQLTKTLWHYFLSSQNCFLQVHRMFYLKKSHSLISVGPKHKYFANFDWHFLFLIFATYIPQF